MPGIECINQSGKEVDLASYLCASYMRIPSIEMGILYANRAADWENHERLLMHDMIAPPGDQAFDWD
jgi:hypothetical protein